MGRLLAFPGRSGKIVWDGNGATRGVRKDTVMLSMIYVCSRGGELGRNMTQIHAHLHLLVLEFLFFDELHADLCSSLWVPLLL